MTEATAGVGRSALVVVRLGAGREVVGAAAVVGDAVEAEVVEDVVEAEVVAVVAVLTVVVGSLARTLGAEPLQAAISTTGAIAATRDRRTPVA